MATRRPWLEALLFIRPRAPGPLPAPDATIVCRGCARKIPLQGIHLKDKVRCQRCGRIHWITEKFLASHNGNSENSENSEETPTKRRQTGVTLAGIAILGLCLLAVAPMAAGAGEILLSSGNLRLLGLSALRIAFLLHLLCYGVGMAVGLTLIWAMIMVRKHTQELGIIGAVMTVFGGLGRMVFYFLGEQMGHPFTESLPYGLVVWGALSTLGALWRASLFPKR